MGSVFWNYIIPPIARETSLGFALGVGVMMCIVSLISVFGFIIFDISVKRKIKNSNRYFRIH